VAGLRVALLLEQALAPVPGGTGRYSLEVAGALARLLPGGVTGWTAWHRDTAAAVVPRVTGPRRLPLPRRPLTLAWERGTGPSPTGAEVVHAPTLLAPPRRRSPLVVTIHDVVPWTHPETLTPRGVRWHRLMAERVAASADAIVVPTAAVGDRLATHLRLRRPPVVVGLGVSALPAASDPDDVASRIGLPADGYVLSLATAEPRKGLDVLVRAMASSGAPDLPLVLVGPRGWGGVEPLELAREAGLAEGRLRHLGRLDDEDLRVVLERATVVAVPSRAEGFGLPVVEAMAAGVPVVTSTDPALVEVGGDAVLSAPIGDAEGTAAALAQAAGDGALRTRLVEAGRRRASGFTWDGTAAQLLALYASLV
jgi:glycosyltransferase involved in cell wall biosynthesis